MGVISVAAFAASSGSIAGKDRDWLVGSGIVGPVVYREWDRVARGSLDILMVERSMTYEDQDAHQSWGYKVST